MNITDGKCSDITIIRDFDEFNNKIRDLGFSDKLSTYIVPTFVYDSNQRLCSSQFTTSSVSGKCVIEPSDAYKGCIARIIFYYYSMYVYGYDKPKVNIPHDLANISSEWKFYEASMHTYYKWATDPQYNEKYDEENDRNRKIIKYMDLPNIFIGYESTVSKEYIRYTPIEFKQLIDDLLFGATSHQGTQHDYILTIAKTCCNKKQFSPQSPKQLSPQSPPQLSKQSPPHFSQQSQSHFSPQSPPVLSSQFPSFSLSRYPSLPQASSFPSQYNSPQFLSQSHPSSLQPSLSSQFLPPLTLPLNRKRSQQGHYPINEKEWNISKQQRTYFDNKRYYENLK